MATEHAPLCTNWSAEEYRELTRMTLLPQHHQHLRVAGISLEVAVGRGYFSVTTKSEIAALGFAPSQQRPPALVLPLWSVDGEVALRQIRPDNPRHADDGRVVKYETPKKAGLRLDVHPLMRQFLGDPERPLFVTEGTKKGDAATTADLCCVCLLGVSGWRGRNQDAGVTVLPDWEHIHLKGRRVCLVFDSDVMTKMPVYLQLLKLRTWLESKGAEVLVVYLPSGPGGAKVGLDDYLAAGHSRDELMALGTTVVRHPDSTEPGTQEWSVDNYRMTARGTFRQSDGGDPRRLGNFAARIIRKSIDDDGDPLTEETGAEEMEAMRYTIEVQKGEGKAQVDVTLAAFRTMAWPSGVRWLDLTVAAGTAAREQLREAIELISAEAAHQQGLDLIPRTTIYVHTGWGQVEGEWLYLHKGGAIGKDGLLTNVEVRLPVELAGYQLPRPPGGDQRIEAVRASLALLDLGPDKLMVPVLGALYRSVLGPSDFSLHSHGISGGFKTQVAKLALAHLCQSSDPAKLRPIEWISTGNSLEGLLHQAKDALAVVDDLLPAGLNQRERDQMLASAARVFRAQGNQGGRSRMRADSSMRPPKAPRGLMFSTGEELHRGISGIARAWLMEQKKGDVTPAALTLAQKQAPLYSSAMAGYLGWLAPQMPGMGKRIRDERDAIRSTYPASHSRTSEIAAHLELGWKLWLEFAVQCGAIDEQRAQEIRSRVRAALLEGCRDQVEEQSQADPVELYRHGLQAAISSGYAYVEGGDGQPPPDPGSWGYVPRERGAVADVSWDPANPQRRLGWLDGEDLYLLPEASFKAASSQHEGGLGIGLPALHRRLRDAQLLTTLGEGKHIATRPPRTVDPGRTRVLHLPLSFLVGPVGPEPSNDRRPSSDGLPEDPSPGPTSPSASGTSGDGQGLFGPTAPAVGPTSPATSPTSSDGETSQFPISNSSSRGATGPTGPTGPTEKRRGTYNDARAPSPGPDPDPPDAPPDSASASGPEAQS
ncbi:MAG: DUF3854 domain-containing protein [Candidatus Dormibacteria bacterium]